MEKSDFFNEIFIAFASKGTHTHTHLHTHIHPHIPPLSVNIVYYEWDGLEKTWKKLRDKDPDPKEFNLPDGQFDGQITEVEM